MPEVFNGFNPDPDTLNAQDREIWNAIHKRAFDYWTKVGNTRALTPLWLYLPHPDDPERKSIRVRRTAQ